MTDSDDRIARRYREIAREEPPPAVDGAILAAARRKVRSRPGFTRWAGPVSIAAVLVLGIGVSLRMQLEKPGIETAAPENEYSLPKDAEPVPKDTDSSTANMQSGVLADLLTRAPEQKPDAIVGEKRKLSTPARPPAAKPVPAPVPAQAPLEERAKDRRADAPRSQDATIVTSPRALAPAAPPAAEAFVPAPAPAAAAPPPANVAGYAASPPPARAESDLGARAAPEPPAAATGYLQRMPQAQLAAPREKKEASADAFANRDLNKSIAPADAERDRELERIAKLRETGKHADADRALEAFRKRYPDFRIPDPMWERVRPR